MTARRKPFRRRGLTLVELLVALAITSTLMVATGAAMDAAARSASANHAQAVTTSRARMTLHRLAADIRSSTAHAPVTAAITAQFVAGQTVSDTGIRFLNAQGNQVSAWLDADTDCVMFQLSGQPASKLLSDVQAFTINMTPMRSADSIRTAGGFDLLERATVTLTLTDPSTGLPVTLNLSAVPRYVVW